MSVFYERGNPVPILQNKVHEYARVRKDMMWERLGKRAKRERHRAVWEKEKKRPASDLALEVFNQNLVFGKRCLQRAAPPTQSVNFEPTFQCRRRHHTATTAFSRHFAPKVRFIIREESYVPTSLPTVGSMDCPLPGYQTNAFSLCGMN